MKNLISRALAVKKIFLLYLLACAGLFQACEKKDNGVDKPSVSISNGHEYVDLGLSVKWATMNVGATTPEDYGNYYAWGETNPTGYYGWSTYNYCNGSDSILTKYCTNSSDGTVDNKTTLELSDDAAHANWGGSWRMPTETECRELFDNCTWERTTQNGVTGYKITSNKSGYTNRSIFLPSAGYRHEMYTCGFSTQGYYWSASLDETNSYYAYYLGISSGCSSDYGYGYCYRYLGQSVRPVLE
jgi:hypothetical protein